MAKDPRGFHLTSLLRFDPVHTPLYHTPYNTHTHKYILLKIHIFSMWSHTMFGNMMEMEGKLCYILNFELKWIHLHSSFFITLPLRSLTCHIFQSLITLANVSIYFSYIVEICWHVKCEMWNYFLWYSQIPAAQNSFVSET